MQTSDTAREISLSEWGIQNGLRPWQAWEFVCEGRLRARRVGSRWYLDREDADRLAHELAAGGTPTAPPSPQPA